MKKKHVFAEAAGRGPDGDFFKWDKTGRALM